MWVKRAECHVSEAEQTPPPSCSDIKGVVEHLESALSQKGPEVCLQAMWLPSMIELQSHTEIKHAFNGAMMGMVLSFSVLDLQLV